MKSAVRVLIARNDYCVISCNVSLKDFVPIVMFLVCTSYIFKTIIVKYIINNHPDYGCFTFPSKSN